MNIVEETLKIWTVGHSTRTLEEFLGLLSAFKIEAVADVRQYPGSRRYPHFNRDALGVSLAARGVEYVHMPELGGRRKARPDSHNTAWRNEAFRGYADYMETPQFAAGIEPLLSLARRKRTAMLCSEAVWWRCHRSMISDYLKAAGIIVEHIMSPTAGEIHPYTPAAQIVEGRLSYAPAEGGPA